MSQKKGEQEFEKLSAYVNLFASVVWGIPTTHASHPSHHLGVVPGKISKSQRLAGLRQAANDTIEASRYFPSEKVAALDLAFAAQNVIALSDVRRHHWSAYKAVIRRGRIRDEGEYYLSVGLVNDLKPSISIQERNRLQELVSDFESRLNR